MSAIDWAMLLSGALILTILLILRSGRRDPKRGRE
jgi:hypothetical protein